MIKNSENKKQNTLNLISSGFQSPLRLTPLAVSSLLYLTASLSLHLVEADAGRQHAAGIGEAARRTHAPRPGGGSSTGAGTAEAGRPTRARRPVAGAAAAPRSMARSAQARLNGRMEEGRRMSGARSSAGTRHRSFSSRALLETAGWSTGSLLSPSHPPTGLRSRLLAWENVPVPSPGETTTQPSARVTEGSSAKLSSNRRALEMP